MTEHKCIKEVELTTLKNFMDDSKGFRGILWSIVIAIIVQVGAFLFLWGELTTTVKYHESSIQKLLSKIDNVKIVGYANAEIKK